MVSAWGWVLLGATVAAWLALLVVWACLCVGARADRDSEQMCAEREWVTDKGAGPMDDYGNCVEQVAELRAQLTAAGDALEDAQMSARLFRACAEQAEAALAALAQPCRWERDTANIWLSACHRSFWLEEDETPATRSYDFCPGCGRPLVWGNAAVDAAALALLSWPDDDAAVQP